MSTPSPETLAEWRKDAEYRLGTWPAADYSPRILALLGALAASEAAREKAAKDRLRTVLDAEARADAAEREAHDLRAAKANWLLVSKEAFSDKNAAEAAYAALVARIEAGMAVTHEHRDALTGRGKFPKREAECVCLGCQTYRALTEKEQG